MAPSGAEESVGRGMDRGRHEGSAADEDLDPGEDPTQASRSAAELGRGMDGGRHEGSAADEYLDPAVDPAAVPAELTVGAPEHDWARTSERKPVPASRRAEPKPKEGGSEQDRRRTAARRRSSSPRAAALPRRRVAAKAWAMAEHTAMMNEAISAKARDQRVSARREVKEKKLDMCDARLCHFPHCICDAACDMRRTSSAQRMRRMGGRYPKGAGNAGNPMYLTFRPH